MRMIKKWVDGAVQRFKGTKILTKLMLLFVLLVLIPLMALMEAGFQEVLGQYEQDIRSSAEKAFDQTCTLMDYRINAMLNSSNMAYSNPEIQEVLTRSAEETDIFTQSVDLKILDRLIFNIENSQGIYRVILYVPGWMMFSDQNCNYSNLDIFQKTMEYSHLTEKRNLAAWLPPEPVRDQEQLGGKEHMVVSMVRAIKDVNDLRRIIGVVKVCILEESVRDILASTDTVEGAVTYIQNDAGEFISCSNMDLLKKYDPQQELWDFRGQDCSLKRIRLERTHYLVSARMLENTDWTLVSLIPYEEIFAKSTNIRKISRVIAILLGGLTCYWFYRLFRSFSRRISSLNDSISQVQKGELDIHVKGGSQDEIGMLIENFNYMLTEIKILLEQQFKLGKKVKNAELKALQAQINPHFLYNTLDLVNWKAIENDVPEIAEIIQYMAGFYRISLNKGQDIIPVSTELEHVRMYVKIQNLRFNNNLRLCIDVEESVKEAKTPKLILQPLVENSILHGIMENYEKKGTIWISGHKDESAIVIRVKDDGIGMTKNQLEGILETKSRGYGVRNINERIKLCCGPEFGLSYHSQYGEGTEVTIRISLL